MNKTFLEYVAEDIIGKCGTFCGVCSSTKLIKKDKGMFICLV